MRLIKEFDMRRATYQLKDCVMVLVVLLCIATSARATKTIAFQPSRDTILPQPSASQSIGVSSDSMQGAALSEASSQQIDTDCQSLRGWTFDKPSSAVDAAVQYDSLRLYVEHCTPIDTETWRAFNPMTNDVTLMSPRSDSLFVLYRRWLISVFFLNTTQPLYRCQIIGAFQSSFHFGYNGYPADICALTVFNFARTYSVCRISAYADTVFSKDSLYSVQLGHDPSHLPPLDSLGLGFLNDLLLTPRSTGNSSTDLFSSVRVSPNPFQEETHIELTLSRSAKVRLEVFDVLGARVYDSDFIQYPEGSNSITLAAGRLPRGTLFARCSTAGGAVETVKLVCR